MCREINLKSVFSLFHFLFWKVVEAYKRIWAAKQKRRPLTKQEKAEIYRLVDEQKRLGDQLEAMPFPGFNQTVCQSKAKQSNDV